MANLFLTIGLQSNFVPNAPNMPENLFMADNNSCLLYGKEGTYQVYHAGEDAIAAIGYASFIDARSSKETLSSVLSSFHVSQIGFLKQRLIGQFILAIKRGSYVYVFSDIMGGRNIFYSEVKGGLVLSSSFLNMEQALDSNQNDLDTSRILEFLAVKHILYPAWLGRATLNRRIRWLLPNEFIEINLKTHAFRIDSATIYLNNYKSANLAQLSIKLTSLLGEIIYRDEFHNSLVAASLTGGRDSRLIATIAASKYRNLHFRTAASANNYDSHMDLRIATKISKVSGIPLDRYDYKNGQDDATFAEMTESFSPMTNHPVTSLIMNSEKYSIGFGGVFGTELFMPLPWHSIGDFVDNRIQIAKQYLKADHTFWDNLRAEIYETFRLIRKQYQLAIENEQDYIRLFIMLITARFGSFIISAFNHYGSQIEPYGCFSVLELALQVDPCLWGNHRRLAGNARIQTHAMSRLNRRTARIITYKTYRPMLPLSISSAPMYLYGFTFQVLHWLKERYGTAKRGYSRVLLPGGSYISNGWEISFLKRTEDRYKVLIDYEAK